MNIFRLDDDPAVAAYFHCDKHVGKMLIESCQMLAAAQHLLGGTASYKLTHQNHPKAFKMTWHGSDIGPKWFEEICAEELAA